jgi:hypothetical protein
VAIGEGPEWIRYSQGSSPVESNEGDRRTDKVANTERFLYSEMPLAPVKYRMCIKKGIPGEAVFGILATAAITDIQNSE